MGQENKLFSMLGRQLVRAPALRARCVLNTKRFGGGFNSKFNFEKPWNQKEGDLDPMYQYDPDFKNESTIPLHDELNPELWGVWEDPDVEHSHIVGSWLAVTGGLAILWYLSKSESRRMYPYFMDEPEICDETYKFMHGHSYYELRDARIGYALNLKKC